MTETKPWYLSRTIWASLVTIVISGAGLFGISVDGVDGSALTDGLLQTVTGIAGVIAILGRLSATDRIG